VKIFGGKVHPSLELRFVG